MHKKDKIGKLLGALTLVGAAVYLTYKFPFWIDDQWKVGCCYLAALLLVLAGITLIIEQLGSNREGKYGFKRSDQLFGDDDAGGSAKNSGEFKRNRLFG